MAYIMKRSRGDQIRWVIRWNDPFKGKGKAGEREVDCETGDHAKAIAASGAGCDERVALVSGAYNQTLRAQLLKYYNALERERVVEGAGYEAIGRRPLYETPIDRLLDDFLKYMHEQVAIREIHGRKRGRATRTLETYEQTFRRFREFLKARGQSALMTGELEAALFRDFRNWLDSCRSRQNGSPLSLATVNMIVRCMRCFVGYFCQDEDTRPYFRSSEKGLRRALGPAQSAPGQPKYFDNEDLKRLFAAALDRDAAGAVTVRRRKPGAAADEEFEMQRDLTPAFPWVAMLALTGARVHELEGLLWGDLDLERGTMVIRADIALKTGRPRIFAFADKRWSVAPTVLEYLKGLKALRERDLSNAAARVDLAGRCVLPANGVNGDATFPRKVFKDVVRRAGLKLTAKDLRSNFCSRMVAQGHSPAIVGMLVGHSAEVESAHYLTYPYDPQTGLVLSDAMGVTAYIQAATSRVQAQLGQGGEPSTCHMVENADRPKLIVEVSDELRPTREGDQGSDSGAK